MPKSRPQRPYGYGIVQYGPHTYHYNVTKKGEVLYIAFEGKNELRAIANRDNVHQRARNLLQASIDLAYELNKERILVGFDLGEYYG